MNNIGPYTLIEPISGLGERAHALSYRVRHHQSEKQYIANMTLLQPHLRQNQLRSEILLMGEGVSYVKEILFIQRRTNKYLVRIIDTQDGDGSKDEKISINAQNCKRLMIEGLLLIGDLHQLGATLTQNPFKYIQGINKNNPYIPRIRQLNNNISPQELKKKIPKDIQKRKESLVSDDQLIHLYDYFYKSLRPMLRDEKGYFSHPAIWQLMQFIHNKVHLGIFPAIYELESKLLEFRVQKQKYSLFCALGLEKDILYMQILNKESNTTSTYLKDINKILPGSLGKKALDFYFLLSTTPEQNIEIHQQTTIMLKGQEKYKQRTVNFQQNQDELEEEQGYTQDLFQSHQRQLEEGKVKKQNQPSSLKITDTLSYPYNCIGSVQSYFKVHEKQIWVKGVCSAVGERIVLTCAHLVYSKLEGFGYRVQAHQIYVTFNGKRIKVREWEYPKQFDSGNKQIRREHDYALLVLEEKAVKAYPNFLSLAVNYKTDCKINLPKIKKADQGQPLEFQLQTKKMQIYISNLLKHEFKTIGGDSGTPLIVPHLYTFSYFSIISLHTSKINKLSQKFKNRSLKITNKVIQDLSKWEDNMLEKQEFRNIKAASMDIQAAMKLYLEDIHPSVVNPVPDPQVQDLNVELTEYEQQLKMMRYDAKKYFEMACEQRKGQFEMQRSYRMTEEKMMQYSRLEYQFIKLCNLSEGNELVDRLKKIICTYYCFIPSRKNMNHWMDILEQMQQIQILFVLPFNWDGLIMYCKVRNIGFTDIYSFTYLFRLCQNHIHKADMQMLYKLFTIVNINADKEMSQLQRDIFFTKFKAKQLMTDQIIHKGKVSTLGPFTSFIFSKFSNPQNFYLYSYTIESKDQQEMNSGFWDLMKVVHPLLVPTAPERIVSQEEGYCLKVKFCIINARTIQQVLPGALSFRQWILILKEVHAFITFLHQKGNLLLVPLQGCMLIDSSNMPIFYYFNSLQSLKSHLERLSPAKRQEWRHYYPLEEIQSAKTFKDGLKIEMWILGESFRRIFHQLANQITNQQATLNNLVKSMTVKSQNRVGLEGVVDVLEVALSINQSM